MSFAGDTGTTINKKMDSTLTVSGGATDKDLSENNINVNADGNNVLSIKLAKEVTGLTSVSAVDGTNTTKLDSTGLSVNNMKFVTESGLDANNLNITNVEEGDISSASSKEAVNGGQLYTTNQTVKRNTEAINSNDRDIAALQEGWNLGTNTVTDSTGLATDTTTVDPIKAGKTLTVKAGNNISVGKTADTDGNTDLTIALRDEVTIGSGNNAITINGTDGTVSGHNFTINGKSGDMRLGGTTTPTVKISGNSGNAQFGKVVINASNGTVNSLSNTKWDIRNITSGQAATEDQLKEAIEQMGNWTGTGGTTKVEAGRNTYVDGLGTKETPYKVNVTQTLTDMREVDLVSDDYAGGTNPNAAKGKLDSSGLSFWTKENTTTTTTTDPSDSTKTITTESIMDPTKVVSVTVDGGISAGMQQVKNVKSAITKSDETTAAAFEASLNTAKQTTPNSATTIEDLSNTYNAIKSLGVDYVGNDTATETNAIVHQDLGSTMKIQGGMDKTDITNDSVSGDNLAVRKNAAGDGLDIVMTKTPAFSKVIAGTLNADKSASATAVTISDTGVQVGDKTYLNQDGLNANSQVITNVASTIESALGDTWAEKLTNASAANSTVRNNAVNVSDLNEVYNTAKKMTSVVAGDNINVTQTANTSGGTDYTVQLAKIVEMGDEQHKVKLDSTAGTVQAGSVVIGKDASFSNRDTITGLDNADWDVDTIDKDDATTYVSKRAATENQLAKVSTVVKTNKMNIDQNASNISNLQTTVAKGFNFTGDDTAVKVNKQLGDTISIVGGQQDITKLSDGNIGVLVDNTTNNLHVRLAKMVNVESVTAGDLDPDSTAPKAVISGAGIQFGDKTYISSTGLNANDQKIINVTDGTEAHDAVNVSQLEAAKTELTNNGVRYAGDIGNEFTQKLGNTATTAMTITGGVKNATDLASGANVGVISDGAGSLKIQLAKKLTDLESVTTNGVTISGTNTNITLNSDGLDMNNKPITNVGSGLGNTDILKAGGDTLNNVATVSDLKTVAEIAAQARTEVKSADKSLTVTESTAVDNANNKSYDVSITQATLSTDTNGAVTVTNAKTKDANGQTIDNENSFVTGNTVKDAINNSGFNLTTAENGTESGTSELINPGDKVTLDAGNNMSITQTGGKITFATTSELKGISKISNNDSDDTKKTEISLGDKTVTLNESSLTGLKDGTVGKDSKDAVTGNQLQNTIDTGLTFEGNYGDTVQRALGTTLKITGGLDSGLYTSEIGHKDDNPKQSAVSSQNIGVRKNNTGDGLEIVMTQQPTFYALGAGVFNGATNPQNSKESSVIIGRDGLFVGGKKYINNTGINANDNKVTRVSAGTISSTSADAVNGSQLYTVQQKAEAHSTVSVGGNTASTDNTDINGGNLVLKRTTENNAHNYDVALNKDVVLGSTGNGNGGTLQVINDGATGDHNDIKVSGTVNNESRDFITIGSQLTNTDGQGAVTGGQGFIKFTEVKGSDVTSTRLSQSMNDTDVYGRIAPRMAYTVNKDSTNTPVGEGSYNLATLQDGTVYAGDISGTNSSDKKIQMPLNSTLTVTGGVVESGNLTNGNIGVVASQTQMTVGTNKYTTAGQLELKLAKDLKGITSISNGATDETKISLGDVQGSKVVTLNSAKVTGLADGGIKENSTDAVTGGQIYTKLADLNSSISSKSDYRLIQSTAEDGAYTVSDAGEVTLTVQDGNDTSKKGTVTIKDVASKAKLEDLTGRVNTAEGKITNNTTAIGENKTAIAGNTANITTNKNSISVNTTNISNLKNLSNISNDGKDVITGLTEVKGIGNVIVTPELDENTRKKTYTVSVDSTGAVVKDETKLVTGGTVYNAIVAHDYSAGDGIEIGTDRKISAKIAENSGLEVKTDGIAIKTDNASGLKLGTDGISVKAKDGGGITVGEDGLLINTDAIKGAINTTTEVTVDGNMTVTDTGTSGNHIYALGVKTDGSVAANDNGIISGGTLYNEVHAAPAEGQTFKYISSDNTVGANLAALDKQTGTNAENITKNAGDITTINNTLNGGLNFKGDADDSSVNKKLGETLDIKGGAAGELSDNNIGVVKDGDDLKVKLAKSLAGLSSVTSNAYHAVTTDSENNKHTTTISGDTLSVDGGVSITKGKITNVLTDSITGDTDVTNKKYVDDKITSVTTNATDYQLVSKGDGYTIDNNGNVILEVKDSNHPDAKAKQVTIKGVASKSVVDGHTTDITNLKDLSNITDSGKSVVKNLAKKAISVTGDSNVVVSKDATDAGKYSVKLADTLNIGENHKVTINGNDGYVTGLTNTTWSGTAVSGRAATEDQLAAVQQEANSSLTNATFGLTGDSGTDSVTNKVNNTVQVKGDKNITSTVVEENGSKSLQIALKDQVEIGTSVKVGDKTTITNGKAELGKVTIDGDAGTVKAGSVTAGKGEIVGLTNTTLGDDFGTKGRAATEEQLLLVKDAVEKTGTGLANATFGLTGDSGTDAVADNVNKTVQVKGDKNISSTVVDSGKALQISLKDDVSVNNSLKVGDKTTITSGKAVLDQVTIDGTKGNVDAVKFSAGDTVMDKTGVTAAQFVSGKTTVDTSGISVKTGRTFDDGSPNDITVKDNDVNMAGNQIHNVAPGTHSGDAANIDQVQALAGSVSHSINKLSNRVNHAGANAAALAGLHPMDFDPDDKLDIAAGYGNYRGANAVAVGAFYRADENTMVSVGGSLGGGENMVNAGITLKLGKGGHTSDTRLAMAKEIRDLRQVVASQNAEMQQMKAVINKIAGSAVLDVDSSALFPDVPANHWAYDYVTKLAQAGVLTGDPDGTFNGNRMMTRYEFAAVVYRAIMGGAASHPELDADGALNRLAKEFEPELKYIRIDTVKTHKDGSPAIERVRANG